jgi:cytochrome d ubiquinol oxidase subunit I
MDALTLARLQFGITTIYHFFFVPLTIGLSVAVALMETLYVRTGDDQFKHMARFWGKLFVINFAMGVVTGIVQEFQFGMNWSEYSRFVGDIFGAPLAVEALVAFFIESTFLGVWIFGWDKLSRRVHLLSIWLVALATILSAFWILVANSFMQHPVGYTIAASGRAEMTDFWAVITNPNVLLQFPHVVLGGLTTAGFFIVGISAWHLLRRKHFRLDMFAASARIGLIVGTLAVIGTIGFGHLQGQRLAVAQPMKLASAEGHWNSEDPAGMSLFEIGDEATRSAVVNVRIPALLSFLAFGTPTGEVQGINNLQAAYTQQYGPGDYVPTAIWLIYWSFRAMVGAGFLMAFLGLIGLFLSSRKRLVSSRRFLRIGIGAMILPYLANTTGWILTEMGRQPWIVFGLRRVEQSVSPNVGPEALLITLVSFTLIYGTLMVADLYLLQKFARDVENEPGGTPESARPAPASPAQGAY